MNLFKKRVQFIGPWFCSAIIQGTCPFECGVLNLWLQQTLVRQSTEGGWWDLPLYLPTYWNYREFLKLQGESCRAGGFVGSYGAVRSVIRCTARSPAFKNSVARSCDRPLLATFRRYTQTEESKFSWIHNVPCTKAACYLIRRYSLIQLRCVHLFPNTLGGS
jgi:hypothetical protein